MAVDPPPLVGFNNNVRYRGLRFHIQTEDSGIRKPHVSTHLFANGGQVIRTIRREYTEHIEHPDRAVLVRKMMLEQHKAMAIALRRGKLDALLANLQGLETAKEPEPREEPNEAHGQNSVQSSDQNKAEGSALSPKTQISPVDGRLNPGPSALSQLAFGAPPNEVPQTTRVQLPRIDERDYQTVSSQAPAQPISTQLSSQSAAAGGDSSPHSETMTSLHPFPPDEELPLHIPLAAPVWRGSQPPPVPSPQPGSSTLAEKAASPATQTSPEAAAPSSRKPVGRPSPRMLREPSSASLFGTTPEPSLDDAILGYLSTHSKRTTGKNK